MDVQGDSLVEAVSVPQISGRPPEKSGMPVWDAEQLRLAITAAGVALWSWNVDTNRFTMDERAFHLWGVPLSGSVTFDDLSSHIHPADRDRVKAAFAATRAIIGAYEIDFRIMVGEDVRWVSARGQGNDADIVGRIMYGIFLDVTGRKQAEEGHELLAGEMSHRVKNLLAIASGLTAITSRSAKTPAEMARELTHRLTALGRAHDLVRPLPGQGGKAALLGDLLTVLLAPYDDMGAEFAAEQTDRVTTVAGKVVDAVKEEAATQGLTLEGAKTAAGDISAKVGRVVTASGKSISDRTNLGKR